MFSYICVVSYTYIHIDIHIFMYIYNVLIHWEYFSQSRKYRSHPRYCRGTLNRWWKSWEAREQQEASINSGARGMKREGSYRSPGSGTAWENCEPWQHFQDKSGTMERGLYSRLWRHGHDAARHTDLKQRKGEEITWLLPSYLPVFHHWLSLTRSISKSGTSNSKGCKTQDWGW